MATTQPRVAYLASRIGPHTARTPEDYLLCLGVVCCRSGIQYYGSDEIGEADLTGENIPVHRPASEVSSPAFLASLLGKTITRQHPRPFVNARNNAMFDQGVTLNPRVESVAGGGVIVRCDLLIKNQSLIDEIACGTLREVSVAYDYRMSVEGDKLVQRDLRANAIGIVTKGRANYERGHYPAARIQDSASARAVSTDGRIETLSATIAKIQEQVRTLKPERATDAIPFADRGATRLDALARELQRDTNDDGDAYGRALRNCLGRDVVSGVAAFKEADAAEPGDGVRRATDGTDDDEAAATFEATCRARFSEGQR
jgi:hypothetical protein